MDRDGLAVWVKGETKKRGWKYAELARRANVYVGSIHAVTQKQRDVFRLCAAIADAFGVPRERALRAAGLLPPVITGGEDDEMKLELDEYWVYLSSDDREVITALARLLYERDVQHRVEGKAGQC
jgi:hypothetical protein